MIKNTFNLDLYFAFYSGNSSIAVLDGCLSGCFVDFFIAELRGSLCNFEFVGAMCTFQQSCYICFLHSGFPANSKVYKLVLVAGYFSSLQMYEVHNSFDNSFLVEIPFP